LECGVEITIALMSLFSRFGVSRIRNTLAHTSGENLLR
jgi:hypothetical protein